MELSLISVATVQQMLVCLARIAAIISSMPVFGTGIVPARAKVALAFMLTLLVFVGEAVRDAFDPRKS